MDFAGDGVGGLFKVHVSVCPVLVSHANLKLVQEVWNFYPGSAARLLCVEIDSSIADGPQAVILNQVTNGIAVRMAVLALSMQGQLQEKGLIEAIAG